MDKNNSNDHFYKLSIAPMLDITTNHFRSFMRLLTKETLLYTEMINEDTILNSKQNVLNFNIEQKPICLQIGGNNPEKLNLCSIKAKDYNYNELNFNCGCPSGKVTEKKFGASLMNEPNLVGECVKEMNKNMFTSIKCRIGLNKYDKNFLENFINKTNEISKINKYIIHCRIAIMGINTIKNRNIPPLLYEIIDELKEKFPKFNFVVNGGIKNLNDVKNFNNKGFGCMIGRAAYDNPYLFRYADSEIFNKKNIGLNRKEIIYKYCDYCNNFLNNFNGKIGKGIINELIKPLTNLFYGEQNNSEYRNLLYSINKVNDLDKKNYDILNEHYYTVIEKFAKINPEAMCKF